MKSGAHYLALGIGLLSEMSSQQQPRPTLVAQVTGSVPPSGILKTPPPAPVAVPPSGVLATVEHSHVPTLASVAGSHSALGSEFQLPPRFEPNVGLRPQLTAVQRTIGTRSNIGSQSGGQDAIVEHDL
jgi:hypothetical protein